VINVTFHGIGEPASEITAAEQRVWLDEAEFGAVLDRIATREGVRITFDDGNLSDVRVGLPALRQRCLAATFFLVAGRLGEPGFLDEDDVRELSRAGMRIGCHGMRHRAWRRLSEADLHEELVVARERLEQAAGVPVSEAACPFGAYDRRVLGALRRYGYQRVFTSDGGTARANRWIQPRTSLGPGAAAALEPLLSPSRPAAALPRQAKLVIKRWR
jgi:peptidoglycan/xylan/chitin deacetylase (PgdA/CDA1 family)